jgi:8-oxo-dGTP pyrophosphatase MutT (NUDIX family)
MLDLDANREAVPPKDAATIILVRDGERGVEVFCVRRSKGSRFLGGAIVFPGGKVDAADGDPRWSAITNAPRATSTTATTPFAAEPQHLRAITIAACREMLEEAAILHVVGEHVRDVTQDAVSTLRARLADDPLALSSFLTERRLTLDLHALYPFARWITPVAEARRYDTRFFVAAAPPGQTGMHDQHETTESMWATPARILERWESNEVDLAPPTQRTLWLLASCTSIRSVVELAEAACLDPICPQLVKQGETIALTLPGDPEHEVRESRVPGPSRYVRRGDRFVPEGPPVPG